MSKIKTTIVIAIMMIVSVVFITSCHRDDELPVSKIEKVSFDEKNPIVAKNANSI